MVGFELVTLGGTVGFLARNRAASPLQHCAKVVMEAAICVDTLKAGEHNEGAEIEWTAYLDSLSG